MTGNLVHLVPPRPDEVDEVAQTTSSPSLPIGTGRGWDEAGEERRNGIGTRLGAPSEERPLPITDPRPVLITLDVDPRRVLDEAPCHPFMVVSPIAVYADGAAAYRCPVCSGQWWLAHSPDYLRGTRL